MAGFRDFQTGEVLTAANVNDFLAKQAVMKFADAAARDTALGTATGGSNALREGMASYLDDTDALQIYDGTSWATVGSAGIGSNVVQTVKTDTFTTTSTSFVDVTGLSLTITPSSATSKVLLLAQIVVDSIANEVSLVNLVRGSTAIAQPTGGGAEASPMTVGQVNPDNLSTTQAIMFLDSPASASAVSYKIEVRTDGSGTMRVNQFTRNLNYITVSSITAIEVAA